MTTTTTTTKKKRGWTLRSEEQKRALVAEYASGALTAQQIQQQHGVATSLIYKWAKQFGAEPPTAKGKAQSKAQTKTPAAKANGAEHPAADPSPRAKRAHAV